jgi:hypothetical protein
MKSPQDTQQAGADSANGSRWLLFLTITPSFNLAGLFLGPQFIPDLFGYFDASTVARDLLMTTIPVVWGIWLLLRCCTPGERMVAWFAFVLSMYWLVKALKYLMVFQWHFS